MTMSVSEQPREMARSLLTGLSWLHRGGYVHRDVRLSNVVYDPTSPEGYKYVLIDFEHRGIVDEPFDDFLLTDWDDGMLENKAYTIHSEMYQLGKLLKRLDTVSSKSGQDFINKLKGKMMTADMVLQHPWIDQYLQN